MKKEEIIAALKEISDLRNVKEGDKVWTIEEGWTTVNTVSLGGMYQVSTPNNTYTLEGFCLKRNECPSCFKEEPFTYILNKLGNKERIIEVEYHSEWYKRRLITILPNGSALCYNGFLEHCDSVIKTNKIQVYNNWRELETLPKFTKEQICSLLNIKDFILE